MGRLVNGQGTEGNLGQVDSSLGGTLVNVAGQSRGNLHTNGTLGLLGATTNVRGQDQVLEGPQIGPPGVQIIVEVVTVTGRLVGVDVESGTGNLAAAHGLNEGRNVDDSTTAGVDQVAAGLHLLKLLLAEHALGLGKLGNVAGDEVCLVQEILQGVDLTGGTQSHEVEDVVEDDRHTHRLGQY